MVQPQARRGCLVAAPGPGEPVSAPAPEVAAFITRLRLQMASASESARCLTTPAEQDSYDQAMQDITAWLDAGAPEPPWDG